MSRPAPQPPPGASPRTGAVRVLFVIDTLEPGGTELSLAALLPHLRGVEARVCHLYPGDRLRPRLEAAGLEVTSVDLTGSYSPLAAVRALRREVRRFRPDVIHSQLWRSGMAARAVAHWTGTPLVHTLVGEPLTSPHKRTGGLWRSRVLLTLDRATTGWVTAWLANSKVIARSHADTLSMPPERFEVVHRGRDVTRFAPAPEVPAADGSAPLLLNVGRLRPAKGQELLLDLMPEIRRRLPGARLEIAGEGPLRGELERHRDRLGLGDAVAFLGHRDDVPALLARADLFLFPSLHEGHPGALVEAMLAAKPILASDIPVHRETLEDGIGGRLLPLNDPAAWSRAVVELVERPEIGRELGAAARRRAVERFDLEAAARAHEAVYRRLAPAREVAP